MSTKDMLEKLKLPNIIITIVIIIVGFNIYNSQVKNIESLKKQIVMEEDKNKVLTNLADLKTKLDSYLALLGRKEVRIFMSSIQNFAKECAVNIVSIKPRTEQPKADYILLPFDLSVTARDYNALARFVNKIENSKDVYFVDSSSITPSGSGQGLKVDLVVSSIILENVKIENVKNGKGASGD